LNNGYPGYQGPSGPSGPPGKDAAPIKKPAPYGMPSRETWLRHHDDSHLYLSIRHHSHPRFAKPRPTASHEEKWKKSQLEQDVKEKFYKGAYRFAEIIQLAGRILKPLLLMFVLPFYFIFKVLPAWLSHLWKRAYRQIGEYVRAIKAGITRKITAFLAPIKAFNARINERLNLLNLRWKTKYRLICSSFNALRAKRIKIKLPNWKEKRRLYQKWMKEIISKPKALQERIRAKLLALENRLQDTIKAPFLKLCNYGSRFASRIYNKYFALPVQRLLQIWKRVKTAQLNLQNYLNSKIKRFKAKKETVKANIKQIFQTRKNVITKKQSVFQSSISKQSKRLQTYFSLRIPYLETVRSRRLLFRKWYLQQRQSLRKKAIEFPQIAMKQLNILLEKSNIGLKAAIAWKAKFQNRIKESIKALIPQRVANAFYFCQDNVLYVSGRLKKRYGIISSAVKHRHEILKFNFLLLCVWSRVIWNHVQKYTKQRSQGTFTEQ
jgi:hypothetical protein